jgi:hypothetical protein
VFFIQLFQDVGQTATVRSTYGTLIAFPIEISFECPQKFGTGWLSKNRQNQGAQISSNAAYLCTLQKRDNLQQRRSWRLFATPSSFTTDH